MVPQTQAPWCHFPELLPTPVPGTEQYGAGFHRCRDTPILIHLTALQDAHVLFWRASTFPVCIENGFSPSQVQDLTFVFLSSIRFSSTPFSSWLGSPALRCIYSSVVLSLWAQFSNQILTTLYSTHTACIFPFCGDRLSVSRTAVLFKIC